MSFDGGSDPNLTTNQHNQQHLLNWLEDSISMQPSFLYEPFAVPDEITRCEWWTQEREEMVNLSYTTIPATIPPFAAAVSSIDPPVPWQPEISRKRKFSLSQSNEQEADSASNRQKTVTNDSVRVFPEEGVASKKTTIAKRGQRKGSGANSGDGSSKEARWAEQLLNPCATAIETRNLSRIQHLFYVLRELASPTGDANHRLAAEGLRALVLYASSAGITNGVSFLTDSNATAPSFVTSDLKLFRAVLIKFHEVSPWFAFPNVLANATILRSIGLDMKQHRARNLHVVDVGVSHGVQWPTLLDALAHRPGGAPSLVRLTIAGYNAAPAGPFSTAPPGYDLPSHLLRCANSINLNLRIDRADGLGARAISRAAGEMLVVCVQFRAGHVRTEDRTAFLRSVRELDPDLVILSEIEGESGGGGGFPTAFARRAALLWRFLDSTSSAFKARDCPERKVVEGEAARLLESPEMAPAEGRDRWRERMWAAGFLEERFSEEAVEAVRALLRKSDGNWEMMAGEAMPPPSKEATTATPPAAASTFVLRWKGQPVSFCSLWKPHKGSRQ